MTYVTSDLHGYPLEKFLSLLSDAGFSAEDDLYVLGDVIDRGTDGVKLLRWMTEQPNVFFILGNHEEMMLAASPVVEGKYFDSIDGVPPEAFVSYARWQRNGGAVTEDALMGLTYEKRRALYDYLLDSPLYEIVDAGGRTFILTHSGFENFDPAKTPDQYTADELLWHRPALSERYYAGAITVFGHTPTAYLDPDFRGRAIFTDTWIDVDSGAAFGYAPMLLRLDDLREFYIEE